MDIKAYFKNLSAQTFDTHAAFETYYYSPANMPTGTPSKQDTKDLSQATLTIILRHAGSEKMALADRALFAGNVLKMMQDAKYNDVVIKTFSNVTVKERAGFYEAIHRSQNDALFQTITANKKTSLPYKIMSEYRGWASRYKKTSLTETAVKTPIIQEPTYPTIIEVDHALLCESPRATVESAGYQKASSSKGPGKLEQPQIKWLVEALMADGVAAKDMTIYRAKTQPKAQENALPYEILDVHAAQMTGTIAVSLTKGHSSYVLKSLEKNNFAQSGVEVAELQKDADAYRVRCYEKDTWINQMVALVKADRASLQEQIKHNLHWKHRYAATVESFAAYCNEQGRMPMTHDTTIISHGPLANKSTFKRVYHALLRGAIPELAGVKSFPALKDHITSTHKGLIKPRLLNDAWEAADSSNAPSVQTAFNNAAPENAKEEKAIAFPSPTVTFH